jgi:hypothetical protein
MARIPFNLDKALAGAKVVTRGGFHVTDWHYFKGGGGQNIVYKGQNIVYKGIEGSLEHTYEDGIWGLKGATNSKDLMLEVDDECVYINVYKSYPSSGYTSIDNAKRLAGVGAIAIVEFNLVTNEAKTVHVY